MYQHPLVIDLLYFFYLPLFKLCFYTLKLWFQGQQWVVAWDTSPLSSRIVSSREGSTLKRGRLTNFNLCVMQWVSPSKVKFPTHYMYGKLKFREVKSLAYVTQ